MDPLRAPVSSWCRLAAQCMKTVRECVEVHRASAEWALASPLSNDGMYYMNSSAWPDPEPEPRLNLFTHAQGKYP